MAWERVCAYVSVCDVRACVRVRASFHSNTFSHPWQCLLNRWNNVSLSFAFMGLYKRTLPSEEALEALQNFLGYLVTQRKLRYDYIIYGLCQVRPFPLSPGARLYREIQTWRHWVRRPDVAETWGCLHINRSFSNFVMTKFGHFIDNSSLNNFFIKPK